MPSAILTNVGRLEPEYDPATTEYVLTGVSGWWTEVELAVPLAPEGIATTRVNGTELNSGETRAVALAPGANQISITVSHGDFSRTYTIGLSRDAGSEAYIKGSAPQAGRLFGYAVALSADGNTLAVGARGAAYVFRRVEGAWAEQTMIDPPNPETVGWFGATVSLSADGDTLAVGDPDDDWGGPFASAEELREDSGAAYVFSYNGETWAEEARLKDPAPHEDDHFGHAISLSSDGEILAVGAEGVDNASAQNTGSVVLFARGSNWWGVDYLTASNAAENDQFGYSVATSDDGSLVAVGAVGASGAAGAVYVFEHFGDRWVERHTVVAENAVTGDFFGGSTTLSGDGTVMAIGAPLSDDPVAYAGAAHIFELVDDSWLHREYLTAFNGDINDQFGFALALNAQGTALVVGAPNAGAVYMFLRHTTGWAHQAYVTASDVDAGDDLGGSVALSADGNTLASGLALEDSSTVGIDTVPDDEMDAAGAVRVWQR